MKQIKQFFLEGESPTLKVVTEDEVWEMKYFHGLKVYLSSREINESMDYYARLSERREFLWVVSTIVKLAVVQVFFNKGKL